MATTSKATSLRQRINASGRTAFLLGLVLLTLGRLYLLRHEDIVGHPSSYDDYLFAQLGEHAFWSRPPDDKSLLRLPAYPIWIWLCHQTGIPLYAGTNFLFIIVSLFLVVGLRQLNVPRLACFFVYAALLYEINAISSLRRMVADNLYGILVLLSLGFITFVLAADSIRRRWIASAGLAMSLSLCSITRAESVLVWVALLLFLVSVIFRQRAANTWQLNSMRWIAAAAVLPLLAVIAAPLGVAAVNKRVFGVFTACSLTSSNFTALTNCLLAITPDHDIPYVPVTRNARMKAYGVSPAFAALKPYLEGSSVANWANFAKQRYNVALEEIGGGWFFYALRNAVVVNTDARTPAETEAYYRETASQLKQAFIEGKLPKRWVWLSRVQPDPTILQRIPTSLRKIFAQAVWPRAPADISASPPASMVDAIKLTFDRVTYRRSLYSPSTIDLSGWAIANGQPVISIQAYQKDGSPLSVAYRSSVRKDVYEANKAFFPALSPDLPFGFSARVTLANNANLDWPLKFIFRDGTEQQLQAATLRLGNLVFQDATQQVGSLRIETLKKKMNSSPDLRRSAWQMYTAGKIYMSIFAFLLILAIPAMLVLLVTWRSPGHNKDLYLFLIPLVGFISARLAVLAIIDASSFNGSEPRYLLPVSGPMAVVAILLISQAGVVISSRLKGSNPPVVQRPINHATSC